MVKWYQCRWNTGYTAITGATKSTYEVQTTDIGKFITVEASYTDDYNGTEVVSAATASKFNDIQWISWR